MLTQVFHLPTRGGPVAITSRDLFSFEVLERFWPNSQDAAVAVLADFQEAWRLSTSLEIATQGSGRSFYVRPIVNDNGLQRIRSRLEDYEA